MSNIRAPSSPSPEDPGKSPPSQNPPHESSPRNSLIADEKTPRNEDLVHISDAKLKKKITAFLEICPSYTTAEARNILSDYDGNLSEALNETFDFLLETGEHDDGEPQSASALPNHAKGSAANATTSKPLFSSPTSAEPPKSRFSGAPHVGGVLSSIVLNLRNPGKVPVETPNLEEEPTENSKRRASAPLTNSSSKLPIKPEESDSEEDDEHEEEEDDEYSGPEPTFIEKAGILHAIFPMVALDDCERAVNYCGGSLDEAVASLEEEYSLSDDSIMRNRDGREDSRAAGPGTNFHRERGRSRERSDRTRKRRRSDSVEERLAKRARGREGERNMKSLPTAGQWVYDSNMFGESNGVLVILDSGKVPYRIPKKVLYDSSQFFKAAIDSATAQDLAENGIRVQGASLNTFNLAMQWIGCKKIRLEHSQCRSKASELMAVMELVQLGVMLGIRDIGQNMVERLREIIIEDRDALKGHHIRCAFALGPGHGIRTLFVNACVRLLIEFRGDGKSGSDPGYGDDEEEEVDAARLGAFAPLRFRFQPEMDVIEDFERNLLRAVQHTLATREMVRVQRNKTMFTAWFEDPLTEERFTL